MLLAARVLTITEIIHVCMMWLNKHIVSIIIEQIKFPMSVRIYDVLQTRTSILTRLGTSVIT
jgi:hypothetical protein